MCNASFNHRSPRRRGWETKNFRDSTVPRDPTGRAYCTEVGVGQKRALLGWPEGTEAGRGIPHQLWRRLRALQYSSHAVHGGAIAALGENRMGHRMGESQKYLQILF